MTEGEWLHATDPQAMLDFLRESGKLSDRKARLFAVAVCHRIWPLLDKQSRKVVDVAERYADHLAGQAELYEAAITAHEHVLEGSYGVPWAVGVLVCEVAAEQPDYRYVAASGPTVRGMASPRAEKCLGFDDAAYNDECNHLAAILRDTVNPFRPRALNPSWRTPLVMGMAGSVYRERDFTRLPALAAALAEAGCDDAELLGHLRGPGPHCRGCWAADEVLLRR